MKYIFKGLSIAILLVLNLGYANADIVNFTLTGTVTDRYSSFYGGYVSNPFDLTIGSTIIATGSFDNTGFDDSSWGYDDADLIDITITVGSTVYTLADANIFGANIEFLDNEFNDLEYNSADGQFNSFYDTFRGESWNFEGDWTYSETVSAVPVPVAAWLFGSGLIGLVGLARRNKA